MSFDKSKLEFKGKGSNLAREDVLQIVALVREDKYTQKSIGAAFGVSEATVSNIMRGRAYNEVTGIPKPRKKPGRKKQRQPKPDPIRTKLVTKKGR